VSLSILININWYFCHIQTCWRHAVCLTLK
jgi:hypothetical protein